MSGRVLFVQRYNKQMPEMEFKGKTVAEAINNGLTKAWMQQGKCRSKNCK
ncbi:hypothetical protein AGMMS49990_06630 [Endomicrobiia bacterium]|nr:hypothetical protein AGMMS49990_06630 [Endomicrobiia bacterium]